MTLTLRQVIPQKAAMEILAIGRREWHQRHPEPDVRVGNVAFYRIDKVGMGDWAVPKDLPDVSLDSLMTSAEVGKLLGRSRASVFANSDYNGGWIGTVSPYGVSRFWLAKGDRNPVGTCGGTTLAGNSCLIRTTGGRRCKLHSSPRTIASQ